MVSPVGVRAPPLLFCKHLQVKYGDAIEPRSTTRALYTNYYTNALGKHHAEERVQFGVGLLRSLLGEVVAAVESRDQGQREEETVHRLGLGCLRLTFQTPLAAASRAKSRKSRGSRPRASACAM